MFEVRSHLDDLEERNIVQVANVHHDCQSNISRLSQLQRKKEYLLQKLQKLQETEDQLDTNILKESRMKEEQVKMIEAEKYCQELKNTLECCRLIGTSVFSIDGDRIIICLDTSYKNSYHESYYIELQIDEDGSKMTKHSLPSFIPALEIEEQYLQSDNLEFLSIIIGYLQAYVARREEVLAIKDISMETPVVTESTEAYDYVEIMIGDDKSELCLEYHLTYDDLFSVFPSRIGLHCYTDEDGRQPPKEELKSWKHMLQSTCLSIALKKILTEYEKMK